ncbi:MAG: hypothetical protein HMLKMBBP_01877 [Planctomycetes bacterium]|nr:hypothetical protein [Planctomycetota bacterium]
MHALAGDALSRTGRHAEAAGRFLLAAAESRTPWAHRDRAACELFDAGDVERAEAMLTDLVAERADDPWPRYHLAVLLSKTGRADGARTHAERALQATSGDATSGDAALRQLVRELLASLTR